MTAHDTGGILLCGMCLRLLTAANRAMGYYSICRECEQELDGSLRRSEP